MAAEPHDASRGVPVRLRSFATVLATLALLVGVVLGVLVAAPGIALALQLSSTTAAAVVEEPAMPRPQATSTAAADPAEPTPAPAPTYEGPLIAPAGSRQITRGDLHAWAASRPFSGQDPANDAVWEQQQWLDIRCMARKGFLEDPTNPSLQEHEVSADDGLTQQQADAYSVAMYGPPTDAPYDWRTAGCHGRSVHLTGQDDNH